MLNAKKIKEAQAVKNENAAPGKKKVKEPDVKKEKKAKPIEEASSKTKDKAKSKPANMNTISKAIEERAKEKREKEAPGDVGGDEMNELLAKMHKRFVKLYKNRHITESGVTDDLKELAEKTLTSCRKAFKLCHISLVDVELKTKGKK